MARRVFAFVFARGQSKGIPRKNLQPVGGTALIGHAISAAKKCKGVERVIVSTDDDEIADVARGFGADVPFMRPAELASDTAPEWLAWQHGIREAEASYGAFDTFLSLPCTSPLRAVEDVDGVLKKTQDFDVVITVQAAKRHPAFNMVVQTDPDGSVALASPPKTTVVRRQDAPKMYDITTVAYGAKTSFILKHKSFWEGRVGAVVVPELRAIDIDTPIDLRIAEFLWSSK